jgi:hypothetical protein
MPVSEEAFHELEQESRIAARTAGLAIVLAITSFIAGTALLVTAFLHY